MLTKEEKQELHNLIVEFSALTTWMSDNRDQVTSEHWKKYHQLDNRYQELIEKRDTIQAPE